MYGIRVHTPPASGPVTAAGLRAHLRLNDTAEDSQLSEWLAAAVERFEADTNRPVLSTTYVQDLSRWPCIPIVLGRGGVTSVAEVGRYLADGSTEVLTGYVVDLKCPPAFVKLAGTPEVAETDDGLAVSPVGYVRFVAGWANAAAVPSEVTVALKMLAGHWYQHREAFEAGELKEVPNGWARVVNKYKLGISGDWGQ